MKILKSISVRSFNTNYLTKFIFNEANDDNVESEQQTDYQKARQMFDVLSDTEQKRYSADFKKMLQSGEDFNEAGESLQNELLSFLETSEKGEGLEKVDFEMMIDLLPVDKQKELKDNGFLKNIMKKNPESKVRQFEILMNPSEEKCQKLFGMLTDKQISELDENDVIMLSRDKDYYENMDSELQKDVFERLLELTQEKRRPAKKAMFAISDKLKSRLMTLGVTAGLVGAGAVGGAVAENYLDFIPGEKGTTKMEASYEAISNAIDVNDLVLADGTPFLEADDTQIVEFAKDYNTGQVFHQISAGFHMYFTVDQENGEWKEIDPSNPE